MSVYIATDEPPVVTCRITVWGDTVWDIALGDLRITVRSEPVVRQHDRTIMVSGYAMRWSDDPNGMQEYLLGEGHIIAARKGVPMPPGTVPTIEHSPDDATAEVRWTWWSVTL